MSILNNQQKPFSMRHQKILDEGLLEIKIDASLRNRLWRIICDHDDQTIVYPIKGSTYTDTSTVLAESESNFLLMQGWNELRVLRNNSWESVKELDKWVSEAWAPHILDFIELFNSQSNETFLSEVNEAFKFSNNPWQLCDGVFLKLDAEFLEFELAGQTQEMLRIHGFEGAFEEFRAARDEIINKNSEYAILMSCNSMESTLKTILGVSTGTADKLIDQLGRTDFFNDLPSNKHKIVRNALKQLAFLRNELAAHGQGPESIDVPLPYAQLCLNLAATYNYFLMTKHISKSPISSESDKVQNYSDDDLPF